MATVFFGHPFPRKGFVYPEATPAVNRAKRTTLALFKPFSDLKKGLIGFLEQYLVNYDRLIMSLYQDYDRIPLLHYKYYSEFSKATWDFTFFFLRKLGISFETSLKIGMHLATIFEFDDAYKFPLIDTLSESSKEKLLKNPRKEILRMLEIYRERSNHFVENGQGAGNRMEAMAKLVSFLLFVPKFKKAFTFALENTNFTWFQYDNLEYYWCLNRIDHKCLGKPFEERKEMQIKLMLEYAQKLNPDKVVKRVERPDGGVDIVTI